MKYPLQQVRLYADFNELFGDLLCLSHSDVCKDADGNEVALQPGMVVTAFDDDEDTAGQRDDIVATGVVEASPEWLACNGSRWALRIDENGVRSESQIPRGENAGRTDPSTSSG